MVDYTHSVRPARLRNKSAEAPSLRRKRAVGGCTLYPAGACRWGGAGLDIQEAEERPVFGAVARGAGDPAGAVHAGDRKSVV